jgi:hypothetical protein
MAEQDKLALSIKLPPPTNSRIFATAPLHCSLVLLKGDGAELLLSLLSLPSTSLEQTTAAMGPALQAVAAPLLLFQSPINSLI